MTLICNLVTVFWETKSVTKSRLQCTNFLFQLTYHWSQKCSISKSFSYKRPEQFLKSNAISRSQIFANTQAVKTRQFQLMWLDKFLRLKCNSSDFFSQKKVAILNRLGGWHLNWCSDRNRLLSIFLFLFPLLHYFFGSLNRAVGKRGNCPPALSNLSKNTSKIFSFKCPLITKESFMRWKKKLLFEEIKTLLIL